MCWHLSVVIAGAFPYLPLVPLCLLFRNPESGHKLGTKSAEGNITSGGSGASSPRSWEGPFHRTIARAAPPRRTTTPVANVMGDPNNANSPKTTSHTGMIAVRLNDIAMMVTLLSCDLRTARSLAAMASGLAFLPIQELGQRCDGLLWLSNHRSRCQNRSLVAVDESVRQREHRELASERVLADRIFHGAGSAVNSLVHAAAHAAGRHRSVLVRFGNLRDDRFGRQQQRGD